MTDRWSKFFKVPKRSTGEEFDVTVPLNLMEPTTKNDLIDIEYLAHVSYGFSSFIYYDTPRTKSFLVGLILFAPPPQYVLHKSYNIQSH